jgi:hypothetical protein
LALSSAFACPNVQYFKNGSASIELVRTASSTRGKNRLKWGSNKCSSKQVAIALRRSSSALVPERRMNDQTASGSSWTKSSIAMIACHLGSRRPSAAARPGRMRSALSMASQTPRSVRRLFAAKLEAANSRSTRSASRSFLLSGPLSSNALQPRPRRRELVGLS